MSTILYRDVTVWAPAAARAAASRRRHNHGYLQLRLAADPSRAGGELYWHGVAGADHRSACASAHPLGQTLFVVSGAGRVQSWGGKVREIKAGDVVWIPPNEKHWHGAAPGTSMVHVATQEALDGKHVTWMEHVSDEQYKVAVGG